MQFSQEVFSCGSSNSQAEAAFCIIRTTIKFSKLQKAPGPAHLDLPVAHVLAAKAKTSVSAKQTCREYRRHVNYPTKNLASKSAFLQFAVISASLQIASIQPIGKSCLINTAKTELKKHQRDSQWGYAEIWHKKPCAPLRWLAE